MIAVLLKNGTKLSQMYSFEYANDANNDLSDSMWHVSAGEAWGNLSSNIYKVPEQGWKAKAERRMDK